MESCYKIKGGDDKLDKLNAVIEYIAHSSFTVEIGDRILVFDYYKGDLNLKDKNIYVFASHGHGDHFNPVILDWEKDFKKINYILSNDIEAGNRDNIISTGPYKEISTDDVRIKTFGSTDLGVSFLVTVDGLNIFHAGDLNWWYWDDDTNKEKMDMENSFKKKIQRIKDSKLDIDIAFFPVDPRLGEYFHMGGEYFINEISPKYFFPMHSWDKYGICKEFIHKVDHPYTKIVDIKHKNQIFEL